MGRWWSGDCENGGFLGALDQGELEEDLGSWVTPQFVISQCKVGDFTSVLWTKMNEMGKVCDGKWIGVHGWAMIHTVNHTQALQWEEAANLWKKERKV